MAKANTEHHRVHAKTRREWRQWLAAHHDASPGVWLVSYKKATGKPRLAYAEAVEEALCFGWIDSRPNALDAERAMLRFSPRKPGSPWSKLNKTRVERLIAGGSMTPAGLAKIEAAQADGSWTVYDAIEALVVPPDLDAALRANPAAHDHYHTFAPSEKKQLLWWVASAKRPATRATRIARIVTATAGNHNPLRSPKNRS